MMTFLKESFCRLTNHGFALLWEDRTPIQVMHTSNRRLGCRSCGIMKWSFRAQSAEEREEIMGIIGMGGIQKDPG